MKEIRDEGISPKDGNRGRERREIERQRERRRARGGAEKERRGRQRAWRGESGKPIAEGKQVMGSKDRSY